MDPDQAGKKSSLVWIQTVDTQMVFLKLDRFLKNDLKKTDDKNLKNYPEFVMNHHLFQYCICRGIYN